MRLPFMPTLFWQNLQSRDWQIRKLQALPSLQGKSGNSGSIQWKQLSQLRCDHQLIWTDENWSRNFKLKFILTNLWIIKDCVLFYSLVPVIEKKLFAHKMATLYIKCIYFINSSVFFIKLSWIFLLHRILRISEMRLYKLLNFIWTWKKRYYINFPFHQLNFSRIEFLKWELKNFQKLRLYPAGKY